MKRLLRPKATISHICELTPEYLLSQNLKGLILDLDNTLVPYKSKHTHTDIEQWVETMQQHNIKLYMLSNAMPKRVKYWTNVFAVSGKGLAAKPISLFFKRALKFLELPPQQVAVVGDQLFTDVLGGNMVGAYTIMVAPLSDHALPHTKWARRMERLVLKLTKEKTR